ncbi:MAG: 50S ribosomal protein L13 [Chloroflexi bacterium]|nr:50S ribosomal protein L13 [Chloroflexota bacterium]
MHSKTYTVKGKDLKPQWRVIDAEGRTLGRLSTEIASVLRGKDKPIFSPHLPVGDYVVVVNAAKVRVTGNKLVKKFYYRHSMYPGGFKAVRLDMMLAKHPERVIEESVWGMLPHNVLGRQLFRRLKVCPGPDHPYQAQVAAQKAQPASAAGKAQTEKAVEARPAEAQGEKKEA